MKVTVHEYDGGFGYEFIAETIEDAAFLVRLGMNRTNELRCCESSVGRDGIFSSYVVIGKRKNTATDIGRAK